MTDETPKKPYTLDESEKVSLVMAYTLTSLVRAELVSKQAVRVSTWFRTVGAPEYIRLYNAQVLLTAGPGPLQSLSFAEYVIPTSQVMAFHLAPPAKDSLDYDPSEPNRKMEPTTVIAGSFRLNGFIRMSVQSNISKHLELSHETYTSVYDVEISNPGIAAMGIIRVPFVLVRSNLVCYAYRG
jgi:hypothetical protein